MAKEYHVSKHIMALGLQNSNKDYDKIVLNIEESLLTKISGLVQKVISIPFGKKSYKDNNSKYIPLRQN